MIGDLIGDSMTSHLQQLIANNKMVKLVEVNPELFNHAKSKSYTKDHNHNFIEKLKEWAQERGPHKCIDLIQDFIKINHVQQKE